MSKKNKKITSNAYSSDSEEMIRMFKVLGIVVVALLLFYVVFAIAHGDIKFEKDKYEREASEIQNEEILAGSTFNRVEENYYVIYYDFTAPDSASYANLYSVYKNSGTEKIFLVDLSSDFNKGYLVDDKSKIGIKDIASLKVVNGTMIKVENGKGVSYSVGLSEIRNTLFD